MGFQRMIRHFHRAEDGAIAVDWLLLTAAVIGLSLLALAWASPSVRDVSENAARTKTLRRAEAPVTMLE